MVLESSDVVSIRTDMPGSYRKHGASIDAS
jgi:hypothetical protein